MKLHGIQSQTIDTVSKDNIGEKQSGLGMMHQSEIAPLWVIAVRRLKKRRIPCSPASLSLRLTNLLPSFPKMDSHTPIPTQAKSASGQPVRSHLSATKPQINPARAAEGEKDWIFSEPPPDLIDPTKAKEMVGGEGEVVSVAHNCAQVLSASRVFISSPSSS
ncbi:hypothetical protein B296_00009951 [Ensete ventricosum]|uniref:Uncharacterized protein n=1 Tax=Ensete ventricosum TaxID=4639 RepID=A0A426ZQJ4_ENSVE|nr:hypothetical protein B296_00009951 [Ensete ventricosum]